MEITISLTADVSEMDAEGITFLNSFFSGEDGAAPKKMRNKQPMPDGPKKDAIKHRFAVGRIDAALERGEDPRPQDLDFVELYEAGIEYDGSIDDEELDEVADAEELGDEMAEDKAPKSKKSKARKAAKKGKKAAKK